MQGVIAETIRLVLTNFTLTFLVLGLFVAAMAIVRTGSPRSAATMVEKLLAWHIFFSVGLSNFYNFVMHAFFGEMTARFIGWADSPFQFEVAMASLGFAAVGFLAAFRGFEMRLAAILGPSIFTLGAAAGHVYQMIAARNFAPGNAGLIFWTDILIPAFGFLLLWLQHRARPARQAPAA